MENEKNSPGYLTAKRFFRNKLAVAGLVLLGALFLFSFLGAIFTPYGQDQVFYRREQQLKDYAALKENDTFRFYIAPGQQFGAVQQAQFSLKQEDFSWQGTDYTVTPSETYFTIFAEGTPVALATLTVLPEGISYAQAQQALQAGEGDRWILQEKGAIPGFRQAAQQAISQNSREFTLDGREFQLSYDAAARQYLIKEQTQTLVWDAYAAPSSAHILGTDKNGMDMLTRLMYGGRVSLTIGFVLSLSSICSG